MPRIQGLALDWHPPGLSAMATSPLPVMAELIVNTLLLSDLQLLTLAIHQAAHRSGYILAHEGFELLGDPENQRHTIF